MGKKAVVNEEEGTVAEKAEFQEPTYAGNEDEPEVDGNVEAGGFKFDTDFNVEEEFKEPPLIPAGAYEGYVTNVVFDNEACALVWDVSLRADSDILMSDGETPVDGNVLKYKNWFPKEGDELERTKNGKMTKRQSKINMINDFQKKMKINMNTAKNITEAVQNAEWIGIEVVVQVEVREWEKRLSNQIKNMVAS